MDKAPLNSRMMDVDGENGGGASPPSVASVDAKGKGKDGPTGVGSLASMDASLPDGSYCFHLNEFQEGTEVYNQILEYLYNLNEAHFDLRPCNYNKPSRA